MKSVPCLRRAISVFGFSALVLVGFMAPQSVAISQDIATSGRDVFHCTEEHLVEIPDLEAQYLTLFACPGLRFIEGGEVATFQVYGGGDYANGGGSEIGYQTITFQDGSKQVLRFDGTRVPSGEAIGEFSGTFEAVGGSGRFANSRVKGEYTGQSMGNNGFIDWTVTSTGE